ncbi:MAG: type II secretion system GspH family protein [Actinobacteria bacterium]|nr:type II secretion system GspH family protein [Actinomycetota bacterium]MCL6105136.1 type II secretion system GspH family protein [Actinomycetota bacterium]
MLVSLRNVWWLSSSESGFTLIELMVVLLIMAVLIAIAIPTFLGVRGSAQDRAAQENLVTAMVTAKGYYVSKQNYLPPPATATVCPSSISCILNTREPSLRFFGAGSSVDSSDSSNTVSEAHGSKGYSINFAIYGQNGSCWYILDVESQSSQWLQSNGGVLPDSGQYFSAAKGQTSCAALTSPGYPPGSPAPHWFTSINTASAKAGL